MTAASIFLSNPDIIATPLHNIIIHIIFLNRQLLSLILYNFLANVLPNNATMPTANPRPKA